MSNFNGRVARLEVRTRSSKRAGLSDDELLEALQTGTYETHHVDALFGLMEPALLGSLLYSAYKFRPTLEGVPAWIHPCYPIAAGGWVIAAGNGIQSQHDEEIAEWAERFNEPIRENAGMRDKDSHIWDAHEGLVKRLFRKHGLDNLRLVAKAICETSIDDRGALFTRYLPRADEARRERMGRVSAPLRPPVVEPNFNSFPLIVLSPDATEFWYLLDNTGHEWTRMDTNGQRSGT